jgi:hypothetical protein
MLRLLDFRAYPVIDYQTMSEYIGHERLFRTADDRFLLHMSSIGHDAEERLFWLSTRDAIAWLNEIPDQYGSFWHSVENDFTVRLPRPFVLNALEPHDGIY